MVGRQRTRTLDPLIKSRSRKHTQKHSKQHAVETPRLPRHEVCAVCVEFVRVWHERGPAHIVSITTSGHTTATGSAAEHRPQSSAARSRRLANTMHLWDCERVNTNRVWTHGRRRQSPGES